MIAACIALDLGVGTKSFIQGTQISLHMCSTEAAQHQLVYSKPPHLQPFLENFHQPEKLSPQGEGKHGEIRNISIFFLRL